MPSIFATVVVGDQVAIFGRGMPGLHAQRDEGRIHAEGTVLAIRPAAEHLAVHAVLIGIDVGVRGQDDHRSGHDRTAGSRGRSRRGIAPEWLRDHAHPGQLGHEPSARSDAR